ncbi:extracellular solute-binding protein [Paenibacillus radicis (ex Xue et al. 2023)]|uniref:Extracellular solute-binding protein n=1 Tax=Paenibacillus radicis (ex Xue et al. 2023) TaxID=2972489 RepID=A0ABT1YIF6_9BACL|nr:extracellular solute-binding protein [Paenibacillus radicis (ex Xue et al. 2023)]MCR8632963.1 extracellular solute-binding protein [Paenibacillus radicis (ex Xue et al. 2023)]
MRKQQLLLAIAIMLTFVCAGAGYYLWYSPQDKASPRKDIEIVTLTIWVYSKEWSLLLADFQRKHPQISMDIRTFRSSEQLMNELVAAVSANTGPQLAEVHSFYGITQLADSEAIVPLENWVDSSLMVPAFSTPFQYKEHQWAVPLGGSLPVLFYKEDLSKREVLEPKVFTGWDEVIEAAERMIKDSGSGAEEKNGLAVDTELPWFFENLYYNPADQKEWETAGPALALWEDWVHGRKVMEPLNHHMAASKFINGKIGFFLSSSDKLPIVERYVGGKFVFRMSDFPPLTGQGIVPKVDGMVVLKSDSIKEKAEQAFIRYMMEDQTQMNIWKNMGIIPARIEAIGKLLQGNLDPQRKRLLDPALLLLAKLPSSEDVIRWKKRNEVLEQLELLPGVPITEWKKKMVIP